MQQQSKTLFFTIIGLALIIVAGMFVVRSFVVESLNIPAGPGQVEIQVVAAPSIKPWAEQAARQFNQANPNTQVQIVAANELVPAAQFQATAPQAIPPAGWLAEASFVVEMAGNSGLAVTDAQSVASTGLAWGVYNSKLNLLNGSPTWQNVHARAAGPDGLKIVIDRPQTSAQGVAALISATAGHLGQQTLSGDDIAAADAWLTEVFGNRNSVIPATPAVDFATKGVSAGDVGILSMAAWQQAKLHERNNFTLSPAEPGVVLNYPFAIFANSPPPAQEAARAFRSFLLEGAQQNALADFHFEPADGGQPGVQVDGTAAQRLLDWANRVLR